MGFVDSFNLYAFNAFDSVNFFDPMGLSSNSLAQAQVPLDASLPSGCARDSAGDVFCSDSVEVTAREPRYSPGCFSPSCVPDKFDELRRATRQWLLNSQVQYTPGSVPWLFFYHAERGPKTFLEGMWHKFKFLTDLNDVERLSAGERAGLQPVQLAFTLAMLGAGVQPPPLKPQVAPAVVGSAATSAVQSTVSPVILVAAVVAPKAPTTPAESEDQSQAARLEKGVWIGS
jgi:hypothetical protein